MFLIAVWGVSIALTAVYALRSYRRPGDLTEREAAGAWAGCTLILTLLLLVRP